MAKKTKKKSWNLEIRKEQPHEFYPTKPKNMSAKKWKILYKPQFLVQQKQKISKDGIVTGMAYYRETTMKKAMASKKALEKKWNKMNTQANKKKRKK